MSRMQSQRVYLPENPPPYYSVAADAAEYSERQNHNKDDNESLDHKRLSLFDSRRRRDLFSVQNVLLSLLLLTVLLLLTLFVVYLLRGFPGHSSSLEKDLLLAADAGNTNLAEELLDRGANVNARLPEFQGRSALHLAAQHGFVNLVSLLLSRGANATIRSSSVEWQSPLHSAANTACKADIVRMLLDRGAKPEDKDGMGLEAMDYATSKECHSAMYDRSRSRQFQENLRQRLEKIMKIQKEMQSSRNPFEGNYLNRILEIMKSK